MKQVKLAAIGEKDVIFIFKSLGADIFPVEYAEDAEMILNEKINEEYGIVFITETIASKIDKTIREYATKLYPSVLIIPGLGEKNDYAISRLRQAIIKAVGMDIISQKQ